MHQREENHLIQDPGPTVALRSAVLLTLAPDQDPGPTLIPRVDPAHAPMAAPIPAPLIQDVMDVVMDAHVQGPALAQGLMDIGALAPHGPLPLSAQEAGREQKEPDPDPDPVLVPVPVPYPTGHALAPLALALLVVSVPAALEDESRPPGSSHRMK